MRPSTVTNTQILVGLRDPEDHAIWSEYVNRYRPMIVAYCRRVGLPAADAEDIAQDALMTFAVSFREGKYDRGRGRLRAWLFGIVHNVLQRWFRARGRRAEVQPIAEETDELARIPDADRLAELWEEEWQQAVVRTCLDAVRAEVGQQTFRAFELFALEGRPAAAVAAELGTTDNAVFLAKHRVLRRMRELRPQLEKDW